ncbi:hypothetical protein MTO96_036134 [Rhipicephalus appendiculatus]
MHVAFLGTILLASLVQIQHVVVVDASGGSGSPEIYEVLCTEAMKKRCMEMRQQCDISQGIAQCVKPYPTQ